MPVLGQDSQKKPIPLDLNSGFSFANFVGIFFPIKRKFNSPPTSDCVKKEELRKTIIVLNKSI